MKIEKSSILLAVFAFFCGLVLLALNGLKPVQLYSPSPYHRYQAEALLKGHFYLADNIQALQAGLAWHSGHVQQVWGLGVGMWLLSFQALWHCLGGRIFPDLIALGVAFALLAFYAGHTGFKISKQDNFAIGLGFIWVIVFCPPIWTLARASGSIFEQTILYSVVLSLGILVALVRVLYFDSAVDYALCFILSAYTIWVRPTHAVYGLIATGICGGVLLTRHHAVKWAALGSAVCLLSFGVLAWTNTTRFGSATEFGHRLTISSQDMIFLTRFENSFKRVAPVDAARELGGMMFFDKRATDSDAFSDNLFWGQADAIRWRKLNLTAFDASYAALILLAVGFGLYWCIRRLKNPASLFFLQPNEALIGGIFLWSFACGAGLGIFYLYYPAMASRYLFDFAPAVMGLVLIVWWKISRLWGQVLWPLLAVWLVFEIATAKVSTETQLMANTVPLKIALSQKPNLSLQTFEGVYNSLNEPKTSGILWNGYGWDSDGSFAQDIVVVAIDHPKLVELLADERRAFNGETAKKDNYRAMIDGVMLPLEQVTNDADKLKVVFDIPPSIKMQTNSELLFLCFSENYDTDDRTSERMLYSIRWK